MIKNLPKNIFRFLALVFAQVLIFNNIELGSLINPYVYILFIILLPFSAPSVLVLLSGFFLGFTLDVFSETMGMHTAATVFMAFIRPNVLSFLAPREGYETGTLPRVSFYGLTWFIKYAATMIVAHHLFLFYIEMFKMQDFFSTLARVLLSSIFSLGIITLSQFFVFRK
jgi:rod shape-determining protein MreD